LRNFSTILFRRVSGRIRDFNRVREIDQGVKTYLVMHPSTARRTLWAFVMASATVGSAQAQNAITAPSNASRSGIQSVITQRRDSLQRRMSTDQPQLQHEQVFSKKRVPADSTHSEK
jgi:hypothetical protein